MAYEILGDLVAVEAIVAAARADERARIADMLEREAESLSFMSDGASKVAHDILASFAQGLRTTEGK